MWRHLAPLDAIFEYNGDALVLLCLFQHGEMRFTELARVIVDQSGSYRSAALLTRSLPRLKEEGLLLCDDANPRHPVYSLSDHGRRRADVLAFVAGQLEKRYGEPVNLSRSEA